MISFSRLYTYGIYTGFSLTFVANTYYIATYNYGMKYVDSHINKNYLNIYTHPMDFLTANILKSTLFGIVFPIIPYVLWKNPSLYYNIYVSTNTECYNENCFGCRRVVW